MTWFDDLGDSTASIVGAGSEGCNSRKKNSFEINFPKLIS